MMTHGELYGQEAKEPEKVLTGLRVRHQRIAHLLLAGLTRKQVAESVGVSVVTVARLEEAPQFKAYMQALLAKSELHATDVRQQVADLVPLALAKMAEHVSSADAKISLNASKDILDRAGYNAVTKNVNLNIGGEAAAKLEEERLARVQSEVGRLKQLGIVTPALPLSGPSTVQSSDASPLKIGVIDLTPEDIKEISPLSSTGS